MATAKPKTKRMMFGGMAKGATGALQKAGPMQKQFMSDKLRGAPMSGPKLPQVKAAPTAANAAKAFSQQKSGAMPIGSQSTPNASAIGAIQKMKQKMGDPGLTMLKAQKAGMMKKGGAVKKKATKK
jgi:hypothetical protein